VDDDFMWAVGIEDTFIGQPHRRTGRVLDEYQLLDHYGLWRDDLDRLGELGVRFMRYGIPWYRVAPEAGRFDWSWTDQVVPHLVQRVGIEPIVDLMHYGCPIWLEGEFLNPGYPERVAEYAVAFAERYHGLVRYFTPLNEPVVNAFFCGQSGSWPPYLRGPRGYTRVLIALAKGMSATISALRAAVPDAVIVQVEASQRVVADGAGLEHHVERAFLKQFLPTDLVLGRVDAGHPMLGWLLDHRVATSDLDWLREHGQRIDIMGINFYPTMSTARISGEGDRPRSRNFYGSATDLGVVLSAHYSHFGLPVMITETSDFARVQRRAQWMDDSVAGVRDARERGVPVVGYTWFPVYSHVGWDYRGGRRPLEAYICDMGLWDIRADSDGTFRRHRTPLVDRYAALVAGGNASVGSIASVPAPAGHAAMTAPAPPTPS